MTEEQIKQLVQKAISEDMKELQGCLSDVTNLIVSAYKKGLMKGIECCEQINQQKG